MIIDCHAHFDSRILSVERMLARIDAARVDRVAMTPAGRRQLHWLSRTFADGLAEPARLAFAGVLAVERVYRATSMIVVELYATTAEACFPACGRGAIRIHSRYRRVLADLPCLGVPVELRATVRRFLCDEPTCARAIFTERLPALARPYARRRARQAEVLIRVGIALGGEAAVRLSSELALRVSADMLLRDRAERRNRRCATAARRWGR